VEIEGVADNVGKMNFWGDDVELKFDEVSRDMLSCCERELSCCDRGQYFMLPFHSEAPD